ncbi:MAG: TrkA family potassium uptake protein [Gemmatimonadetes bacterium]|nr:TrkA family potassium uptake protein [Gemmatimonadota bacterium]
MKRFVIIGLGNFGSAVAERLFEAGHDVTTIDRNEEAVDRMAHRVTRAVAGDGRNIDVLRRIGADQSDVGIVSTGDDITASILATLALRDLGVTELYVKVVSHDHGRVLEKIGVTETVFPERESGIRLATRVASRGILNYIRVGEGFGIQEMAVPETWIGRSLRSLELPRAFRISIVAVHDVLRNEMQPIPDPDAPLKESDTLLILGRDADLTAVASVR